MHKGQLSVLVLALALVVVLLPAAAIGGGGQTGATEYVVLYTKGASLDAARAAVAAAGGTIVSENAAVGVATVTTTNASFLADVAAQKPLAGAAKNAPVGKAEPLQRADKKAIEKLTAAERAEAKAGKAAKKAGKDEEPLVGLQWDMEMIHATSDGSYKSEKGDKKVLVGILDTGVDASHPDIAPNFDEKLSRNFTFDIPSIDGPCEYASCKDPADVDDGGHGTHVAGTVGAALNRFGIAGVAPKVTLVNLRAGQDSGYFFLQPSVDALVYAADNGIDVINMSYFIDPWLYNCMANPADSPTQQNEQRVIIEATQRALDYAHDHGVTLIAAAGNEHTDTGNPTTDSTSPDYPPGTAKTRTVDNSCLVLPTEGHNVISVGAVGPSTFKADYSNWGTEQTVVTAPGGYFRDFAGTPQNRVPGNLVLSTYPRHVAIEEGGVAPDGTVLDDDFYKRDCDKHGVCGYYTYLQGTSMASPHAVGVAALIVSRYGRHDKEHRGLTMDPAEVEQILRDTATDHACPSPPVLDYTIPGRDRPASWNATCTGTTDFNSIWGEGIVDALAAVAAKK